MKILCGRLAATFGALILGLVCAPSSWAGCVNYQPGITHSSWDVQPGHAMQMQAALIDANFSEPSIVGFWHFTQMQGINVFDAGYEQWHSDGTEIFNSGGRSPDTGNFCLGVWQQVGIRHYKLNHRAIGWVPGGSTAAYVAAITEDVTLSATGNSFSGTYKVSAYDLTGHLLQVISSGKVTATRITAADTVPGPLF
jgi:hypothetical protein